MPGTAVVAICDTTATIRTYVRTFEYDTTESHVVRK